MDTNVQKNAIKEASKIAQYYSSIHKLGGLSYFCTTVENGNGSLGVLQTMMETINKDKKVNMLGKVLLSYDENAVTGIMHLPSPASIKVKGCENWLNGLLFGFSFASASQKEEALKIVLQDSENAHFTLRTDMLTQGNEAFSFKTCDQIQINNTTFLREKNALPVEDDDQEEEEDYAAAAGIEW